MKQTLKNQAKLSGIALAAVGAFAAFGPCWPPPCGRPDLYQSQYHRRASNERG